MKASRGRNFRKRDSRSTQPAACLRPGFKQTRRIRDKAREQVIRARRRGGTPIPRMSAWTRDASLRTRQRNTMEITSRATNVPARRSLRSYWVLRETELLAAMERPGLACITNATATMPETGIDFRGPISRECSRIARRSGLSQNALGATRVAPDGSDWGSARFIDPRAEDWISELLIMIDRFQQLRLCQDTYGRMTESSSCVCMYARFNNLCYAKILCRLLANFTRESP